MITHSHLATRTMTKIEPTTEMYGGALLESMADRFHSLSDVSRLRIIIALSAGELSATEISATTGVSKTVVAKGLTVLRKAGMVRSRRQKVEILCSAVGTFAHELVDHALERVRIGTAARSRALGV